MSFEEEELPPNFSVRRLSYHNNEHPNVNAQHQPAQWMSPLCQRAVQVNEVLQPEDFQQEYVLPLGGVLRGFRLVDRNKTILHGFAPISFVVLYMIVFGLLFPAAEMFEVHNSMFEELATESIHASHYQSQRTFMDITDWSEYWHWTRTVLFPKAFACCASNGQPLNATHGAHSSFTLAKYNRLISPVRFRQVREQENQCAFPMEDHALSRPCWEGAASPLSSWTGSISSEQTNFPGSRYISGGLSTLASDFEDGHNFGDGGHVVDLDLDETIASDKLTAMADLRWTDEWTRVIAVDVNTYNPNLDLATTMRLMVDQTQGGQLVPSIEVCSCKLDPYSGLAGMVRAVLEVLMVLLYLGYVLNKLRLLWFEGPVTHLKQVYNFFELIYLIMFLFVILSWMDFILDDKAPFQRRDASEFHDLVALCRKSQTTARLAAFTLLWSFVHAFKHVQIYRNLALTWEVLAHSMRDTIPFFLMLCLAAGAFGLAGYWAFGPRVYDFHTWSASTVLLIRTIISGLSVSQRQHGRGELYAQMKEAQPVFAPMWACLWIVLCTLIFFNMFIAIITNSFIFVSQRNRYLAALEEKYPIPSPLLLWQSKIPCCVRDPEKRSHIDELNAEIAIWDSLFQGFSRDLVRRKLYDLASRGSAEFSVSDAVALFPAQQVPAWRNAIAWMVDVSDRTGLRMARHKHKHSTNFQIELLIDKVAKLEEEALGLTVQLKDAVPRRLQPSPI
mmetsp:Transcript_27230/g.63447  ORF Transcript_27230/g.63447 Transcript_27230/m.63447 type:complete len:729 (-) Transcript_27230:52-2238(-)|eukprot:CAMPEP_0178392506 /NCGR_PEP_ID=MMETSP0689_2-20121128/11713_1 /TAXON_ID=160604 /ORGANISM="Amphidinium massartii, Strain CS-259" /LENGTH=728 /DNA_ID=CAMNT_0020013081 /DNA_START=106 /DNA_END=2292 /DNA_ORIENTATION=+